MVGVVCFVCEFVHVLVTVGGVVRVASIVCYIE